MITLKEIEMFASNCRACHREFKPFISYINNNDYKSAWQTVLGNINWLNAHGLDILSILELADYTGIEHLISGKIAVFYKYDKMGFLYSTISLYGDGSTQSISTYKNNERNGKYISYNNAGGKMMETEYLNHYEHGTRIYYDSDGNIYLRYKYIDGERICELLPE